MSRPQPFFAAVCLGALGFALSAGASAQPAVNYFTIDGGGGVTSGGGITITSSIGQHDAGRLIGGNRCLKGGFIPASLPDYCEGDANRDGQVSFPDITEVIRRFNQPVDPCRGLGDANADGIASFPDIASILRNFAEICP